MFIALLNAGPGHLILKSQDHGMASWHLIRNATSVLFAIGKIPRPPVLLFISPSNLFYHKSKTENKNIPSCPSCNSFSIDF